MLMPTPFESASLNLQLFDLRREVLLREARSWFTSDFNPESFAEFVEIISESHSSIKDYLGYIMLDFALVDGELEQIPFGWAFQFAETIQLKDVFDIIVKKELQLSDKKLQQHKQKTMSAWYKIKEGEKEQVYEGDASV